ncbi:hypothetical protein O9X98_06455 [Agrobacterium salinitolerans]|nr:hypothetical protein [Agrobacterium salinitolerans]
MDIILIDDETPEYPSPAEVGEAVVVTGTLCNTNSAGGTTILKHDGVRCVVTKAFWDYETGWHYHGRVEGEADVEAFRAQSTSVFTPGHFKEKFPNNPNLYEEAVKACETFDPGYVYFSEHDFARKPTPPQKAPAPRT